VRSLLALVEEAGPRVVVSGVHLVRDPEQPDSRLALVVAYRYDTASAVRTLVDLSTDEVVEVTEEVGAPVPLAPIELALARELALDDARVREAIAPYGPQIEVEGLLSHTTDTADPLFGHRIVHLLFRTPTGYLTTVGEVYADLTVREVVFAEAR
jgi:hypothetical protein